MKKIYEYEIEFQTINKRGKEVKHIVQQSAFSYKDAVRRIKSSLKRSRPFDFKLRKRFTYPHMEGGKRFIG